RRTLGVPFEQLFESEICGLLGDPGFRAALAKIDATSGTDDRIFLVVNTLLNRLFARYVDNLSGAADVNLVTFIKELVALVSSNVFVSLPYLIAFLQQSSDCIIARDVRK